MRERSWATCQGSIDPPRYIPATIHPRPPKPSHSPCNHHQNAWREATGKLTAKWFCRYSSRSEGKSTNTTRRDCGFFGKSTGKRLSGSMQMRMFIWWSRAEEYLRVSTLNKQERVGRFVSSLLGWYKYLLFAAFSIYFVLFAFGLWLNSSDTDYLMLQEQLNIQIQKCVFSLDTLISKYLTHPRR